MDRRVVELIVWIVKNSEKGQVDSEELVDQISAVFDVPQYVIASTISNELVSV